MNTKYKQIPQINEVINTFSNYPREVVKEIANDVISLYRIKIKDEISFNKEDIYKDIEEKIINYDPASLTSVINATGVILHTNLGRAVLSDKSIKKIVDIASNYSNLEYNLEEGRRGSRYNHLIDIVRKITGAEDAIIVNNNAAAVFLMLNTFCKDTEVLISRGELVEIGDSFRISEIMKESGCELVEIGATNRTHLYDYENNLSESTSAIMKVHKSNFKIIGFYDEVDTKELKKMADKNNLILMEDLGSGSLIDLSKYGFGYEKTVQDCINDGVDLVSFSCDKLLGTAQGGIICGKKELIEKIKKNQLLRAFRVDKLTLAAVEETLINFMDFESLKKSNPTIRMITEEPSSIQKRAKSLFRKLNTIEGIDIQLTESTGKIGGGSYPDVLKKTYSIEIKDKDIIKLERYLRLSKKHIITTVHNGNLYLNALTIFQRQIEDIYEMLRLYYEK